MRKISSRILPFLFIILSILACSAAPVIEDLNSDGTTPTHENPSYEQVNPTPTFTYLPLVRNGLPKFIGYIDKIYWSKENVERYMPEADNLSGLKNTAVGWFIDIQDPAFYEDWETEAALNRNNLYRQLERLWEKGYLSFVKIGSSDTIDKIISGNYDARIAQMAKIYKKWVDKGEGRKAMLAPLQEMNGDWVAYYPKNMPLGQKQQLYKQAYQKIQAIFEQNGVGRNQVWWVFAANGLSSPDVPENNFEYYYPGNDAVDIVGFASYNYGYCTATYKVGEYDYGRWENYDTLYEPYIRRMETMAPGKPIIITETGTSAIFTKDDRPDHFNYSMKAQWFYENYSYIARQRNVLGVFYFDINEFDGTTCDLRIPRENFTAYRDVVAQEGYRYLTITELKGFLP